MHAALRIRKLTASAAAFGWLAGAEPPAAQGFGAWSHHQSLVMNTTADGADVAGDVKGYPVAVKLDAGFDFSQARPNGEDLRFSTPPSPGAPDGTPLPFEIERWDPAGKSAAAWVKTDVKGNSKDQSLVMHWGNAAAVPAGDGKAVFAKAEGWVAAWHLAEKGTVAAGGYKDATANAVHGRGINVQGAASAPGRVGMGLSLAHARKEYLEIEGSESNPLFQLNANAVYSIWTNARSHNVAYQAMFAKGETGFRIHYYGLSSWPENKSRHITEPCQDPGDRCPLKGSNANAGIGTDVKLNEWFHLMLVVDKTSQRYYINGVLEVSDNGGSLGSGAEPVCIGNNGSRDRSFDGLLDEARILNVAKDVHWAKLEYESQREGSRFLQFQSVGTGLRTDGRALPALLPARERFDLRGHRVAASGGKGLPGLYLERSADQGRVLGLTPLLP